MRFVRSILFLALLCFGAVSLVSSQSLKNAEDLVSKVSESVSASRGLWNTLMSKGGSTKNCAACALIVGLIEQVAQEQNIPLQTAADAWCSDATAAAPFLSGICQAVLNSDVSKIQADFNAGKSPDYSCQYSLNMCPPGQCNLFPQWPLPTHKEVPRVGHPVELAPKLAHWLAGKIYGDELAETLQEINSNKVGHGWLPKPLVDLDGDGHAPSFTLRGLQWRGMDCNDLDPNTYPGRIPTNWDTTYDTNCNGIFGADNNGNKYEETFCSGANTPKGLVIVGDSATAHFSLPPSWFHPADVNSTDYSDLIDVALTEADWPQCSWSTAWANTTDCPQALAPMKSIYQRMRDLNLCMHRDYQNHGVNGASSQNVGPPGMIEGMHNRNGTDQSALIFVALIGNDVCGAKHFDGMTTPAQFYKNMLNAFNYIDERSAANSFLVASGLVDGRVLYEAVHDQIHPLGMPYSAFYDFLNCLDISPCWGWMNTNSTIRNTTTAIAESLSAQYDNIFAQNTFKNFDTAYVYPDFVSLINRWVAAGGKAIDLIEKVDGFHPSQTGNNLFSAFVWEWLEANVPQALPVANPNNAQITEIFGNQGGHGVLPDYFKGPK